MIPICIIIYILIALIPYMGSIYISEETKSSFDIANFYGQYNGPERVMLLECPQDAFFHRVNLISNARESILLASFSIHRGVSSDIVMGALLSAADRGVQVKILNNAFIGQLPARYRNAMAVHENISVYVFNPFEFFRPRYANSVMHDKYMVVDGEFMIIGGRNIADRDFIPDCFTGRPSFDREVLVYNYNPTEENSSIAQVTAYFNRKIASGHSYLRSGRGNIGVRYSLIDSYIRFMKTFWLDNFTFDYYQNTIATNRITLITNPFEGTKKESVVAYNLFMLTKNSDRVVAQSPYIALTNRNFEFFTQAVTGRDFTLLTNSLASTPNLPAFSAYVVRRSDILATGIRVYEYQCNQSSLHGKTYLFDGRLTAIGSFNINERSIRSDTESMLIIDSAEFHDIMLEAINAQIAQSLRVNPDGSLADGNVEEASPYFGKRALYNVAGRLLRGLWFMF